MLSIETTKLVGSRYLTQMMVSLSTTKFLRSMPIENSMLVFIYLFLKYCMVEIIDFVLRLEIVSRI